MGAPRTRGVRSRRARPPRTNSAAGVHLSACRSRRLPGSRCIRRMRWRDVAHRARRADRRRRSSVSRPSRSPMATRAPPSRGGDGDAAVARTPQRVKEWLRLLTMRRPAAACNSTIMCQDMATASDAARLAASSNCLRRIELATFQRKRRRLRDPQGLSADLAGAVREGRALPGHHSLPNSAAVSTMRFEKPHSLSYQLSTRTSLPSTTAVCVASKVRATSGRG